MKLPPEILNQHVAVLGKTRSGKSSVMRGLVEGLLERQLPVCIVDPKGDWWGLKLQADGKRPGYPVVIFGGEHADVPITEHAGAHVAELFATGNRPCLIDLGGWMVGPRTRFWVEFASTLFKFTKGQRWLVVDEVHNFAPKGKVFDAEAGKALHWTNRLASEGLGKGIAMLFASQRPQKVHNDTLTSAETLIAMRVLHPSDRGAVADWIKGCGDAEGSEVLNSLAQMERGEGWVWSPEIGFGPKRVKFPMFTTYDSFRPQTIDDTKRLKGWAEVDLDDVRQKLASVIAQAKADDPKELRRQLAQAKKELNDLAQGPKLNSLPDTSASPVLTDADRAALRAFLFALQDGKTSAEAYLDPLASALQAAVVSAVERAIEQSSVSAEKARAAFLERLEAKRFSRILEKLDRVQGTPAPVPGRPVSTYPPNSRALPSTASIPAPRTSRTPAPSTGSGEAMPPGERAVLTAAAQYADGVTRDQLGVLTGYKRSSRDAYIVRLQAKGWLDTTSGRVEATQDGINALGPDFEPLPTGAALLEWWRGRLPEGERRVLDVLVDAHPNAVDRERIDDATGYKRSPRDAYLVRLGARKLVSAAGRGAVRASEQLFG